jgi:hypothetical protein
LGFAFWTVVGVDACPDFPCCEIVSPQLPLLIKLSLILESDVGFRQELLIEAASLTSPVCLSYLANAPSVTGIGVVTITASRISGTINVKLAFHAAISPPTMDYME